MVYAFHWIDLSLAGRCMKPVPERHAQDGGVRAPVESSHNGG